MKKMTKAIIAAILLISTLSVSAKTTEILIVTGGHDFDRESFFKIFDSFEGIHYTEIRQPEANHQLGTIDPKTFDVVVFYDMPKTIDQTGKDNYFKLLKLGKGLVFLHHALASYQDWEEYKTIVGGKYHEERNSPQSSTYQHDITFLVSIENLKHAVTEGISDFEILDEVYGNTEVLPKVTTLLTTNHPQSSKVIGWTHLVQRSRVVYLQPGHDKNSYSNPSFQKLVKQAIAYAAVK
jgi:type 1 glutamine amidotransferase